MLPQASPQPKQLTLNEIWDIHRRYETISTLELFDILYPGVEGTDVNDKISMVLVGIYANGVDDFAKFIDGIKDHGK